MGPNYHLNSNQISREFSEQSQSQLYVLQRRSTLLSKSFSENIHGKYNNNCMIGAGPSGKISNLDMDFNLDQRKEATLKKNCVFFQF